MSRDPIGEEGGECLHLFVGNRACDRVDYLGLKIVVREGVDFDKHDIRTAFVAALACADRYGMDAEAKNWLQTAYAYIDGHEIEIEVGANPTDTMPTAYFEPQFNPLRELRDDSSYYGTIRVRQPAEPMSCRNSQQGLDDKGQVRDFYFEAAIIHEFVHAYNFLKAKDYDAGIPGEKPDYLESLEPLARKIGNALQKCLESCLYCDEG